MLKKFTASLLELIKTTLQELSKLNCLSPSNVADSDCQSDCLSDRLISYVVVSRVKISHHVTFVGKRIMRESVVLLDIFDVAFAGNLVIFSQCAGAILNLT
jgi:hypothetical protein